MDEFELSIVIAERVETQRGPVTGQVWLLIGSARSQRLLKMCPWASYDTAVARPHMSALARLARQCASYALAGGTDLLHDAQAAPRLFAALAAGGR